MKNEESDILRRALAREKAARLAAESILETKSLELYQLSQELKVTNSKLENLLKEKTSELRGVFENINDAYVVMDLWGNTLKMNDAARVLLAFDNRQEDVNLLTIADSSEVDRVMDGFESLIATGSISNLQIKINPKDSRQKLVQINASLISDENNNPIAAQGIIRDITHDKEVERKIIESENRLATLIQNLDSGVLLEDPNGVISLTNKKFCHLLKIPHSPEELKGKYCGDLRHEVRKLFENPKQFEQRVKNILDTNKPVLGEELTMIDGRILERDYLPIFENGRYKGHLWKYQDVTLKRKYRKSVEQQREKYRGIIANMNLGLIEVDPNDRILMVNKSFIEISGYEEDELIGEIAYKKLAIATSKNKIKKENLNRKKGVSNSYEIEIKRKDGEIRNWFISGAPNFDLSGEIVGSVGVIWDITDAKRNLNLLEEKKDELDVIFNSASIGIVLGRNGKILRSNTYFDNLLGYQKNELVGLNIKDITDSDDKKITSQYLKNVSEGNVNNFILNKRYQTKSGSKIWARTNVVSVKDFKGNPKYDVAIIEDITEKRNRSVILKMVNNLTKSILGKIDINEIAWEIVKNLAEYLESDDCVIYVVDWENNKLVQKAAFGEKLDDHSNIKNILELPIGEGIVGSVVKTGKSELIHDTSKDKRYIVDDKSRLSEITVPIIRNNKVIAIIDSEHPQKNHYNERHVQTLESVARLVGVQLETAVNISKREKAEAINAELLIRLEKRNDELHEYAHVVSHDLKAPLRSLSALFSWIKEDNTGKFDEETINNFGLIDLTLEKMEQLISDILLYSSVDKDNILNNKVDLNEVIEDVKTILFLPDHVEISVVSTLPVVRGDRVQFLQLFQNLIGNAVKYNDKAKGEINVSCTEESSFYKFAIQDNGIGIADKDHDKIFKIFQSLNKEPNSSGIGLSIVKKIVDLYQGEIWLESELGKGTTFYFTIKK